jgi:hypothetical protein
MHFGNARFRAEFGATILNPFLLRKNVKGWEPGEVLSLTLASDEGNRKGENIFTSSRRSNLKDDGLNQD